MRFVEGEYYHVFNRGVEKRTIFLDDSDRWRFLALLLLLQGEVSFPQINRLIKNVKHSMFDSDIFTEITRHRTVELVAFCLMGNHFHLMLHESTEGGISKYMQRLLNAYTKYFNARHKRSGHLFAGKFKSVHIDRNEYLTYLSAYIHANPRELKQWSEREMEYVWSSFQDFAVNNRWAPFLNTTVVMSQFKNGKEYRRFVEETPVKLIGEKVGDLFLG
ncbi:MAG: transposase [Patescibacteria group bacterium]